jgi:DNA modification methylase
MNKIIQGDCIEEMKKLPENSVDAIVTDPPYGLEFMGKEWDRLTSTGFSSGDFKGFRLPAHSGTIKNIKCPECNKWIYDHHPRQCRCGGVERLKSLKQKEFHYIWAKECLRVLKPGGFLLSFGGTRTYHRMVCGIEDAGFEIRDTIMWLYGSGFPKSLNIGKQIDKLNGRPIPTKEFKNYLKDAKSKLGLTSEQIDGELNKNVSGVFSQHYVGNTSQVEYPTKEKYKILKRVLKLDNSFDYLINWAEAKRVVIGKQDYTIPKEVYEIGKEKEGIRSEALITAPATPEAKEWEGWGTALKPACEPIVVARKPLSEKNVALNVLKWGTGGMNIDESRIGTEIMKNPSAKNKDREKWRMNTSETEGRISQGRFPANIILDEEAGKMLDEQSGESISRVGKPRGTHKKGLFANSEFNNVGTEHNDKGGASRFFYCPKANKNERNFGCEELKDKKTDDGREVISDRPHQRGATQRKNNHPTVKPIKLMEYLIKLVSKEGATILDPFLGSGTTAIACVKLSRMFIGIEKEADYIKIAKARIKPFLEQTKLGANK